MKLIGRIVKYLVFTVYAACGLALLAFMVPSTGLLAKSVATGSMRPAIPTGSLVVIQKTPINNLSIGDIVTYKKAPGSSVTITHRIVGKDKKSGVPYFITKGDANHSTDFPIPGGMIIGKVVFHVPYVGAITGAIKAPVGLLMLVILPGLLIIIAESHRLRHVLQQSSHKTEPVTADKSEPPQDPPPAPRTEAAPKTARRPLDGMTIRHMTLIIVVVASLGIGTTLASITTSKVTLKNITLKVSSKGSHDPLSGAIKIFEAALRAANFQLRNDIKSCLDAGRDTPLDTHATTFSSQIDHAVTQFDATVTDPAPVEQGSVAFSNHFNAANSQAAAGFTAVQDQFIATLDPDAAVITKKTTLGQCLATAHNKYLAAVQAARDQLLAAIHAILHQ